MTAQQYRQMARRLRARADLLDQTAESMEKMESAVSKKGNGTLVRAPRDGWPYQQLEESRKRLRKPFYETSLHGTLFDIYTVHCFQCLETVEGPDPDDNHARMEEHYRTKHADLLASLRYR